MIGQELLSNKIGQYTLDTFPRSIILLGDTGSGRHTLCNDIADRLKIEKVIIDSSISYDNIEEFTTRPTPYLYIFNADVLSIKQQNVILKFLEEPLNNCYIVIICRVKQQLLDTILNRCQLWTLSKYEKDTLTRIVPQATELQLSLASTPGQLIALSTVKEEDLYYMTDLSSKILNSISRATVSNILSVPDRFYYGTEESGKYSFDIFLKFLLQTSFRNVVEAVNSTCYNTYMLTEELFNKTFIPNINKKQLFENYLLKMKGQG